MKRITIGISAGDPNGIGIEVALRAFADARVYDYFTPVLFASPELVELHREANGIEALESHAHPYRPLATPDTQSSEITDAGEGAGSAPTAPEGVAEGEATVTETVAGETAASEVAAAPPPLRVRHGVFNVVRAWEEEPVVEFGRVTAAAGAVAEASLAHACAALAAGAVDALVTAPINKSAMQQAGFGYPGHTEYLEARFAKARSLMLMVGDGGLRVAVATNHVPLREVARSISPTILGNKIALLHRALERDFGIVGPSIAVLGLNPHAGDGGAIGSEERETIRPAVEAAKARGMQVMGPYPADGFFGSGQYRDFDGVLAMYHDQGLIPFKTLAFGGGVNFTAGLSVVRTSPDHGTALDIAGRGRATADSFAEALFLARDIFLARGGYDRDHANPLSPRARDRKRRGAPRPGRGGGRAPTGRGPGR